MDISLIKSILEVEDHHWWFQGRRNVVSKVLGKFVRKPCGDVLEIGCGSGANFPVLEPFGKLHAVEMDETSRDAANARGATTVLDGYLPDGMPLDEETFGLVAMLDVLEHIENDAVAVEAVKGLLLPGGHFLVTVPAFQFLWSHHDDLNVHYRRYSRRGLIGVLQKAGLEVLYCTYTFFPLFPMFAAVRLLERFKAGKPQECEGIHVPHPIVNNMLGSLVSAEGSFMPFLRYPFGSSLLAIARKAG
jgi:SAM-dependent methyltransferase